MVQYVREGDIIIIVELGKRYTVHRTRVCARDVAWDTSHVRNVKGIYLVGVIVARGICRALASCSYFVSAYDVCKRYFYQHPVVWRPSSGAGVNGFAPGQEGKHRTSVWFLYFYVCCWVVSVPYQIAYSYCTRHRQDR